MSATRPHFRFFRTGDLAVMDKDGYYFLKDRLKRMINVYGCKVWPAEVESALYAHAAVQEACVIAVPDRWEGRLGNALKPWSGSRPDGRVI